MKIKNSKNKKKKKEQKKMLNKKNIEKKIYKVIIILSLKYIIDIFIIYKNKKIRTIIN